MNKHTWTVSGHYRDTEHGAVPHPDLNRFFDSLPEATAAWERAGRPQQRGSTCLGN